MANRRKFIAGLGALATGSAAAMGTGAFTSVSAQRAVDVNVATDSNAYLSLNPTGDRATSEGGNNQLKLDLDGSNNGSQGLNPDARTAFTDMFEIRNQGDNDVLIAVGLSQDNIYEDGSSQGNAEPHLFDTDGVSGFVFDEDPASGTGSGLGPTADNFEISIDSGGRVDLREKFETTSEDDDRLVTPGETVEVDLSIITEDVIGENGDGIPSANKQITVMAVEPGSDRDES